MTIWIKEVFGHGGVVTRDDMGEYADGDGE